MSIWSQLKNHYQGIKSLGLRDLFQQDSARAQRFSVVAAGIHLDYSKNRMTPETLTLLIQLAQHCHLPEKIVALFKGAEVNGTEHRPALHTALRCLISQALPEVREQLAKMETLVLKIHEGSWKGFSGKKITDVVNIGIGGSDLGPRMVVHALKPYHLGLVHTHFVSNVDGADIATVLEKLNPETTLFIVASKSFTTQETLMNAQTARAWLLAKAKNKTVGEAAVEQHFIAISSKPEKAKAFGIDPNNVFEMWDWVGGRYSLWSTIGMPVAFSVGMTNFKALLAGAHAMDQHFLQAPLAHNMPVILGLLGVWYTNFFDCQSQAVIPYDESLSLLPNYLQQLDMESNGKSVTQEGDAVQQATAPILWGGVGTNGQHAFHQLLHQGTVLVPVDFIIPKHSHYPIGQHHAALFANCLAQAQALMWGKTLAEAGNLPYKVIAGNKPSNLLMVEKLTPETLGALIALYEHKVYVQSILWNINAFDQWGVELGKQLGAPIFEALTQGISKSLSVDSSTQQAMDFFTAKEKPWVILDRDGVINHDSDDYIKKPEEWHPVEGSIEAIAALNKAGIPVAVATNQAGVARGLFDLPTLSSIHEKLKSELNKKNGHIDALAFCPHHPDDHCHCRKPSPGLLQHLSTELGLPLSQATFVGDSYKDFEAAQRVGCRFVLVRTGKGERTLAAHPELANMPGVVYNSLKDFVKQYLDKL